jgi:hypothetical protein
MSCLKPERNSVDKPEMPQNAEGAETNEEYTELVQKSYDNLFEPWLKPDEDDKEDVHPSSPSENPN